MTRRWRAVPVVIAVAACAAISSLPADASAATARASIVRGQSASRAYPFAVSLAIRLPSGASRRCGGALVAARYVVTAGHCISWGTGYIVTPASVFAYIGSASRSQFTAQYRYGVSWLARHPSFTLRYGAPSYDAAVLQLDRPAPVEQIPLPRPEQRALWAPGVRARAIGWGYTAANGPSNDLLEVSLPIVSNGACAGAFGGILDPSSMLCAGAQGRGICLGDSGGPLFVPDGPVVALAGITSWYPYPCATRGYPDVFTRVGENPINSWLRSIVPQAVFAASDTDPEPGQPVTFREATYRPESLPPYTSLSWDLDGDGAADDARGSSVTRSFPEGNHIVRLAAASPNGDKDVWWRLIKVRPNTPVAFTRTRVVVSEGRRARVRISPRGPGEGRIFVATASRGAKRGRDFYAPRRRAHRLDAGGKSLTLVLRTREDRRPERNESFVVRLTRATGGLVPTDPTRVVVRIIDDD